MFLTLHITFNCCCLKCVDFWARQTSYIQSCIQIILFFLLLLLLFFNSLDTMRLPVHYNAYTHTHTYDVNDFVPAIKMKIQSSCTFFHFICLVCSLIVYGTDLTDMCAHTDCFLYLFYLHLKITSFIRSMVIHIDCLMATEP